MVDEIVAALAPVPPGTAVDCTVGGGGHAAALLTARPDLHLVGLDRDDDALAAAARHLAGFGDRVTLRQARFDELTTTLEGLGHDHASAVLFDLGVSSMQIDAWERGFSYATDAPLDMRMDPSGPLTAADLVNEWPERRLAETFRAYGEERHAKRIAAEIVRRRPFETTSELVDAIRDAVPPAARFGRGHPAKRTFQALRIAVNEELDSLDRALPAAWDMLPVGGRLGAISFHSLEDRRVKRFIADLARGCVCPPELPVCVCGHEPEAEPLARRAVSPSPGELEANPRARSAHLRAARKLIDDQEG